MAMQCVLIYYLARNFDSLWLMLHQVSRPYKQAEFEITFGEGVNKLVCMEGQ